MESDCAADDDLAALLLDFEPLPDALFSSGGAASPTDVVSDEEAASEAGVAAEIVKPKSAIPITYAARAPPRDGGRRARYRARSRNELMYLREVVKELERELERCKHGVVACKGGDDASELATSTQAAVWKALAVRQRLERQQAEAENARLRGLLENQLRFAAQLRYVLRQRVTGTDLSVTPGSRRVKIETADAGIFERYLAELDSVRTRTDDVLRETGIDLRPESPHRIIRMGNHDSVGEPEVGCYAEFLDTHIIHSDLETARHIWPVVVQHYLQRNGAVYEPKDPQSGVHSFTYGFPYKWFGRNSSVSIIQSVKTFDERDRQVNVYRVLSVGEGALAGLATDQTGWSVLTRSKSNANHTVCRVVARLTPMRFHRLESRSPEDAPPQLLEFAKVLFQMCDVDVGKTIAQLEQLAPGGTTRS